MINNVALLVVSCDSYSDIWPAYFESFKKYWPDCALKLYWGSNNKAFPYGLFTPILVGHDKDYSSNLIEMIRNVQEDWVLLWIDDFILRKPVSNKYVEDIISKAVNNEVTYLKLANTYPWSYENTLGNGLFDILPKGIKYRVGVGLVLWNKVSLIEELVPGESAWQIERSAGYRTYHNDGLYCALKYNIKNPPFVYHNTIIKGKWNFGTKRMLRNLKMLCIYSGRNEINLGQYFYIKAYECMLLIFKSMRYYWR